ncbi:MULTISPECIES: RNA polymerase sigma factor [Burkholderia]|uniref:RNA polymerase sigma factor n=1 Tax=Burkholderia TaxID=32008 RepID=UPI0008422864|nr:MULTISPECIES: sigma-70 family RNA polymerase sigma factor [unclassified Burkholderia]AOK28080.1 hypothetical protein AQ611_00195 [Burkholderia sp. Bp7605]
MEQQCAIAANTTPAASIEARFAEAWDKVRPNLWQRARRLSRGDRDKADELLAITALKVFVYMRNAPQRIREPEGFMFMVLNHVFLDTVRRGARDRQIFDYSTDSHSLDARTVASDDSSIQRRFEIAQMLSMIERAVDRLPAPEQALFRMKFQQDLPYPVIAAEFGINEALARKRIETIRRKLRKLVDVN